MIIETSINLKNKSKEELILLLNESLGIIEKLQKENEELKNGTRRNGNELEVDVNCDWITLQKILDEFEKSNEYILYKNKKRIKIAKFI